MGTIHARIATFGGPNPQAQQSSRPHTGTGSIAENDEYLHQQQQASETADASSTTWVAKTTSPDGLAEPVQRWRPTNTDKDSPLGS